MPKNEKVFFTKDIRFKPTTFTIADGTASKQVFAPSAEGSRVDSIIIGSTSSSQKIIFMELNDGTDVSQLGHITVPANAGTNGSVPIVNGLNRGNLPWLRIDANGNPYINLNAGMNLQFRLMTALSGSEIITVAINGANYDA